MNSPLFGRVLFFALLGLGCLLLFAGSAPAAQMGSSPVLQANIIYDFVADRTRLIQVSLVMVTCGCALLWWKK